MVQESGDGALLRVIDVLDHPHGNRILRAKVDTGTTPAVGELRRCRLRASGPHGREAELQVLGFPLFGGEQSDERIRTTRRVDLLVAGTEDAAKVSTGWELRFADG